MALDPTIPDRLLTLARTALEAHLAREVAPRVPADLVVDGFGVFVTLRVDGDLRGCLGALDCAGAIPTEIVRLGAAVASSENAPNASAEPTSQRSPIPWRPPIAIAPATAPTPMAITSAE